MATSKEKGLHISTRSFLTAIGVIFCLMVLTYILALTVPAGEYERIPDAEGNLIVNTDGAFTYVEGGIPFWKWLLSPVLVLGASGSGALIAVIAFLLVIGGIFNALDKGKLMQYMLDHIIIRFGKTRYQFQAVITLFFMALGAFIGSFEECVPLVPLVVGLSIKLGWDALTGLGMSILAAGCGFASGVCNPFTVGVAQELAGLPLFSGIWLRLIGFALIYALLLLFLRLHARRVEAPLSAALSQSVAIQPSMDRGLWCFAGILGFGIVLVLCSTFLPFLQDLTMVIVAVMFLVAGIAATLVSGMPPRTLVKHFLNGMASILPAVLMILMASSIRYTMEEGKILDTLLHGAVGLAETLPRWTVILFIYLLVLIMNFFISSGSAKAFLLMPLIVPLAAVFDLSPQLCVMAFAFGDGFSNVFYPTNPVLLISLGLADTSYGKWVRWTWKFQLLNLLLTGLLLLFGLVIHYQ
jgi:uncharacterized ion transporter superfamily protein YfcC